MQLHPFGFSVRPDKSAHMDAAGEFPTLPQQLAVQIFFDLPR
jgi:hypothetical protein